MFWLVAMTRCSCHGARMGFSSLSRSFHSFFDRFGTRNLPVYEEDWLPAMAVQDEDVLSWGYDLANLPHIKWWCGWPIQTPGTTLWHFLTMMLWWRDGKKPQKSGTEVEYSDFFLELIFALPLLMPFPEFFFKMWTHTQHGAYYRFFFHEWTGIWLITHPLYSCFNY